MTAILNVVSPAATLVEALEPLRSDPGRAAVLLDIDGTLAPIVRHAADAHVPEATRSLLIEIAGRYRLVGCVSGRRASTARQIVAIGTIAYVGNHGGELLRPRAIRPEVDPQLAEWTARVREFAAGVYTSDHQRMRVRSEDKDAIAAFHWRGAPDEELAARAVQEIARQAEAEGLAVHWGRKVLEVRPPVAIGKGLGIAALLVGGAVSAALYVGDDTTDLDAFRGLRAMVDAGELASALCVAVDSDEAPPSWPRRPTSPSTGRAACANCWRRCCSAVRFVDFLRSTVMLSAGAATALAAITVLSASSKSDTQIAELAVGWWVVAIALGLRLGRRSETTTQIARLLAGAQASSSLPESRPGASSSIACGRWRCSRCCPAAWPSSPRRFPASLQASRSSGRSRGAARTPP